MNKWNTLFWEIMAELPLTNWVFTIFQVVSSFCPCRTSICHSFTLFLSQVNFPFTVFKTEGLFEPIRHFLLWNTMLGQQHTKFPHHWISSWFLFVMMKTRGPVYCGRGNRVASSRREELNCRLKLSRHSFQEEAARRAGTHDFVNQRV